jgi:hypothetical protein
MTDPSLRLPLHCLSGAVVKMKISFHPFRYVDQIPPNGFLVDEPACHALWYYYTKAQRLYEDSGEGDLDKQIILSTERWKDLRPLRRMFRTTAQIYKVDPDAMERFWPAVTAECRRLGFPLPHTRIMHPFAYLTTKG